MSLEQERFKLGDLVKITEKPYRDLDRQFRVTSIALWSTYEHMLTVEDVDSMRLQLGNACALEIKLPESCFVRCY